MVVDLCKVFKWIAEGVGSMGSIRLEPDRALKLRPESPEGSRASVSIPCADKAAPELQP